MAKFLPGLASSSRRPPISQFFPWPRESGPRIWCSSKQLASGRLGYKVFSKLPSTNSWNDSRPLSATWIGHTKRLPSGSQSISVGLQSLNVPTTWSLQGGGLPAGHVAGTSASRPPPPLCCCCCCRCRGSSSWACGRPFSKPPWRPGMPKPPARKPPPNPIPSLEAPTGFGFAFGFALAFAAPAAARLSGGWASNFWQEVERSPQVSGLLSTPMRSLMLFASSMNSGSLTNGPIAPIIL
mmetsp:Transcript_144438/g.360026  ORF Transcript_144438/g.360026 Transcript_144438/m.360026 type:complete len:239 (-) Transcript_144438:873-1589(-)